MRFSKPGFKITKTHIKRKIAKAAGIASLLALFAAFIGQVDFRSSADAGGLTATYFGNHFLTDPKFTRVDDAIDFDWAASKPHAKIPRDNFSIRWEGFIEPRFSEVYTFHTSSDDGVRLWIDGQLIVDNWTEHSVTTNTGQIALTAGAKYTIKMEFYERWGDAVARLSWSSTSQVHEVVPKSVLTPLAQEFGTNKTEQTVSAASVNQSAAQAQYFSGRNFDTLLLTRSDREINFDWSGSSPDGSVPSDNFTARWTGTVIPPTDGNYTFYSLSDDGVKVWVNDLLVINNWSDHPLTENIGILNLSAGKPYSVKVEYYENSGQSTMMLLWSAENLPKQVVPFTSVPQTVAAAQAPDTSTPVVEEKIVTATNNPFAGAKLYVNANNDPARWVREHSSWDQYNASLMEKISSQPEVHWLGNWNWNIKGDVTNMMNDVTGQGALPVFVIYNLPFRDCGNYSAGGINDPQAYRSWIGQIAETIGNRKAVIIMEPDGLTLTDCLNQEQKDTRFSLIRDAVNKFKSQGQAVYLDAGHPGWLAPNIIAERLKSAGIDQADGFALNIANFFTNDRNTEYGKQVSDLVGGKHFVVDTGRSGSGPTPDFQWCNPPGRSLGTKPTTDTGNSLVDAYLWVKGPGGSDGSCNGAPPAGQFWPEYALGLAQRTNW